MVSSVGKFLGSRDQKIADEFHSSGAAKLCPPDNSAHISAHNAVRSIETVERQRVSSYLRARHQEKLDRNYERAQKRAQKKGRELPPKDEYYNHWGYSYYSMVAACPSHAASFTNALPVYSPFMFPYYYAPGSLLRKCRCRRLGCLRCGHLWSGRCWRLRRRRGLWQCSSKSNSGELTIAIDCGN